jgi:3-oxoadipate enol-lactonase
VDSITIDGRRCEFLRSGSGPDLLLVHSLLTDASVFDDLAPRLAARHRVTTINLPGYGASDPAPFETIAEYADHVAALMDALALPPATDVFGNGFGAFVVTEFALRHPARLRRLVIADVNAGFPPEGKAPFGVMAEKVTAGGMQAVLEVAIGRMFPEPFQQAHPDIVAERKRRLAGADPAAFARACRALAQLDLSGRLPSLALPVLVLCGELDRTTPPELARAMAGLIPGARYAGIPGSGHCPMLEAPQALAQALLGFLDG